MPEFMDLMEEYLDLRNVRENCYDTYDWEQGFWDEERTRMLVLEQQINALISGEIVK